VLRPSREGLGRWSNFSLACRESSLVWHASTDRQGSWGDYLRATKLGAFGFVGSPLEPSDVGLALLRAIRLEERKMVYLLTAW